MRDLRLSIDRVRLDEGSSEVRTLSMPQFRREEQRIDIPYEPAAEVFRVYATCTVGIGRCSHTTDVPLWIVYTGSPGGWSVSFSRDVDTVRIDAPVAAVQGFMDFSVPGQPEEMVRECLLPSVLGTRMLLFRLASALPLVDADMLLEAMA